jgi:hypothetical protein
MATVEVGRFYDGLIVFQIDYHDVQLRIQRVRCINNGARPARAMLFEPGGTELVYQRDFPPGVTVQNVAASRTVEVDPDGGFNMPYETRLGYPV